MENYNILHDEAQQPLTPKGPQFLTVLCILSYIWSAIVLLGLLICLLASGFIFETLSNISSGAVEYPGINAEQMAAIDLLLNMGQKAFVMVIALSMIAYMTSALGVYKMWKLQKSGFYIYAVINILGVGYSFYSGSYFMAIIALAFIVMYYLNLKYMHSNISANQH